MKNKNTDFMKKLRLSMYGTRLSTKILVDKMKADIQYAEAEISPML